MIINTNVLDKNIRPIKYGGTGADNKNDALKNLGGISIKKLWENASTTSGFAAQTVSLNSSGYDNILIEYRYNTSSGSRYYELGKVGYGGTLTFFTNIGAAYAALFISRAFTVEQSGIEFESAYSKNASTTTVGSTTNERLIPTNIYGIKGVQ